MNDLVAAFPAQLVKAQEIATAQKLQPAKAPIKKVFISGLGGSGIGGTIVKELAEGTCPVPVVINKDYFAPAFIGPDTLCIICSYSGNTEETVSVLEKVTEKGAQVVCITSGGKIASMAAEHGHSLVMIPGGMPPRSCIGYSMVQILQVMSHFGLMEQVSQHIDAARHLIEKEQQSILQQAEEIAQKLMGKTPVIYSLGNTEGVSVRFRQQLNENSKMLCWHHVIPEMNHNELVGWAGGDASKCVVVWRYPFDYYRSVKRLEICKEVFSRYTAHFIEIEAKGNHPVECAFYAIHLGDWISCKLADLKGVDAMDIKVIDHLKGALDKV